MRAIRTFLSITYLAVIFITLYVSIIVSVFTSRYAFDLLHYEAFQQITCEEIFFGKRDVNENGTAWYCRAFHWEKEGQPISSVSSNDSYSKCAERQKDKAPIIYEVKNTLKVLLGTPAIIALKTRRLTDRYVYKSEKNVCSTL